MPHHSRYKHLFCFCCILQGRLVQMAHDNALELTFCPNCGCNCTDEYIYRFFCSVVTPA